MDKRPRLGGGPSAYPMSSILRFFLCILLFPVDLALLTVDAWRMTLEGFPYRKKCRLPYQPCIYCRGLDFELCPRPVQGRIRCWNPWLLKALHPELRIKFHPRRLRPLVFCGCENGYVHTPRFIPFLAMLLALGWTLLVVWALWQWGWGAEWLDR